jgi:PAS domain S-box-containing protein
MKKQLFVFRINKEISIFFISLALLYLISLYSFLLFHSLAEMFSVVIACGIFMLAWNSREFFDNKCLLFLGIAYLFIGFFDLLHTLSYKGMGVFPGYGANLPTQLWIIGRYMESLSLLIAPFFLGRRLRSRFVFAAYLVITLFLLGTLFVWNIFPDCYIEGVGLTAFKKISEYIISLILLLSVLVLLKRQNEFDKHVLRLLIASIVLTICSEMAFTFYVSVYGFSNALGHFFKIISFYLIYKAVIVTSLGRPYDILFRNLKQNEESLKKTQQIAHIGSWERSFADDDKSVWSDETYRIFGIAREDYDGTYDGFLQLVHPRDRESVKKAVDKAYSEKTPFTMEYRIIHADGAERIIRSQGEPQLDKKGNVKSLVGTVQDITERKKSEEKLLLTQFSVERAADAIYWVNRDAQFLYVNEQACQSLGYTREELLSMTVMDINPHFDMKRWKEHWEKKREQPFDIFETLHRRKDGAVFPVEVNANYCEFGGKGYSFSFVRDIRERKLAEKKLRAEIDKLTTLTEGLSLTEIGVGIIGKDYQVYYQNKFLRERFGEISESFCYQRYKKYESPCEDCPVTKAMQTKELQMSEQETFDGRVYEVLAAPLINPDGTADRVIKVIKDITERKQVEEALRESEARYRSLFEDSPVALWEEDFSAVKNYIDKLKESGVADFRGYFKKNPSEMKKCAEMVRIVDVNNAAVNMLGYGRKELMKNLLDIFREESLVVFLEELVALAEGKTEFESEAINKSIYRDRIFVNLKMTVVPGHEETWSKVLISITDITERKLIEQHITKSLEEKDTLLKEIHHRVKNNMQIISSLLTLQAASLKDKKVSDIFVQCKLRIQSMALVHEKLYQTEDLANINLRVYIKSLVHSIFDSYGKDREKIMSQFDIGEITLDIDTAIPLGLIINELVSNSLKYAFSENGAGEIGIFLHESGEESFMMKVRDNGIGFPENIDFRKTDTLGLQLVTILTETQLHGRVELYRNKGTEFRISFKKKKKFQRG